VISGVGRGSCEFAYLDVFVKLVGPVLTGNPTAEIFVLHFLNPLDCVFGYGV
jgi:hypothetical protein